MTTVVKPSSSSHRSAINYHQSKHLDSWCLRNAQSSVPAGLSGSSAHLMVDDEGYFMLRGQPDPPATTNHGSMVTLGSAGWLIFSCWECWDVANLQPRVTSPGDAVHRQRLTTRHSSDKDITRHKGKPLLTMTRSRTIKGNHYTV